MIRVQIIPRPYLKRIFDVLLTLILCALLAPFFLIIFIATKIEGLINPSSRGPFFYKEIRYSQGKPFNFYKIRIFKQTAIEKTLQNEGFIHTKELEEAGALTLTGKFLKKFYLDELAQLFNILKGEMSFVGPRPLNAEVYKQEMAQGLYSKKIMITGLTGLVQISKTKNQPRTADYIYDEQYADFCRQNNSIKILLFDIYILIKSFFKILKGEGL